MVYIACNARKQYFSGSHSFNEDEPLKNQQHGSHAPTRQYSISTVSTSEKETSPSVLVACPFKNVSETKGWGIQSCGLACGKDEDCPKDKGYKCSCDGPCGLTCNKVEDGIGNIKIQSLSKITAVIRAKLCVHNFYLQKRSTAVFLEGSIMDTSLSLESLDFMIIEIN